MLDNDFTSFFVILVKWKWTHSYWYLSNSINRLKLCQDKPKLPLNVRKPIADQRLSWITKGIFTINVPFKFFFYFAYESLLYFSLHQFMFKNFVKHCMSCFLPLPDKFAILFWKHVKKFGFIPSKRSYLRTRTLTQVTDIPYLYFARGMRAWVFPFNTNWWVWMKFGVGRYCACLISLWVSLTPPLQIS